MHVSLAQWYGTADMEKMSAAGGRVDDSEVLVIRALWEAAGRSKESLSAAVREHAGLAAHIGGGATALQKVSQAESWLTAWDRAESRGVAAARSALLAEFS